MADKLAAFYGKVDIFQRNANGNPINGAFIGDVSKLGISQTVQTSKHNESYSGFNALTAIVVTGRDMTIEIDAHDYTLANLGRYMYATVTQITSGSVVAEALGTGAKAGETKLLAYINVDPTAVFTVSAGGSDLVEGVDYTIDRGTGRLSFITAQTGALTADYSYLGFGDASMFTTADSTDYFVRLSGYNKVDGKPVVVELYRVRFEPIQNLGLIDKNVGSYSIKGDVLWDSSKPMGGALGQFGRIRQVD